MKGSETATKPRKSPQAARDSDLSVSDRRHAALRQTKMYQDAQRLLKNATELKEAIAAFIDCNDPEEHMSHDKIAAYLNSDAKGFLWALNMYVGSVATLMDLRTEVA